MDLLSKHRAGYVFNYCPNTEIGLKRYRIFTSFIISVSWKYLSWSCNILCNVLCLENNEYFDIHQKFAEPHLTKMHIAGVSVCVSVIANVIWCNLKHLCGFPPSSQPPRGCCLGAMPWPISVLYLTQLGSWNCLEQVIQLRHTSGLKEHC